MSAANPLAPRSQQAGAALLISLIALLVLMLLAVAVTRTTDVQLRLAGNAQFQNEAMNDAEAAAAQAEAWLKAGTNYRASGFDTYDASASPELYPVDYMTTHAIDPLAMTWSNSNSRSVGASGTQRYVIEQIARNKRAPGSDLTTGGRTSVGCNKAYIYRITARATGGRAAARYVQTVYSVASC